jgi:isopenicillin N synthase-like dioxygenase
MAANTDPADPRASAVETSLLPVVDLAALAGGDPAGRVAVVAALREACLRHGFFYLAGHGVPAALMQAVVAEARRFFAQDAAAKASVAALRPSGLGYGRMGGRALGGAAGAPVKEEFYYARDAVPGMDEHNRWPVALPGFRETLEQYIAALHALAERVMGLLAETCGLPADHFAAFCREPLAKVRLARYPPEGAEAGAHSDFGALTFLLQEDVGGLQVFDRVTGGWIHARPIPGSFVVNLGDLFPVFTNGAYPSTPHRVVHPAGQERISVPFFYTGAHDYVVRPLPGFMKPGESARFAPVTPAGNLVAGHEAQGF